MTLSPDPVVVPLQHHVRFCADGGLLARHVATFLAEGWREGEASVVVAAPDRRSSFADALREKAEDLEARIGEGRLVWMDARETLGLFMTPQGPEWSRFDEAIGSLVRSLKMRGSGVRAYGEMVDLLWRDGKTADALRLEEHWNRLKERESFSLFCNYTLDLLDPGLLAQDLEAILSRHTHTHPSRPGPELQEAFDRAMTEVLGAEAVQALGPLIRTTRYPRPVLAGPEASLLWVRRHLPAQAREILARTRDHLGACGAGPEGL